VGQEQLHRKTASSALGTIFSHANLPEQSLDYQIEAYIIQSAQFMNLYRITDLFMN